MPPSLIEQGEAPITVRNSIVFKIMIMELFFYAGETETEAIASDPNLADLFANQGVAFKSL